MSTFDDDFRTPDSDQQAAPDADDHPPDRETPEQDDSVRPGDPILIDLADVESQPLSSLWKGRIPLGKVTVKAGLPDQGKSFVSLDIAARLSVGAPWPDGSINTFGPSGVVMFASEDGVADTIVPRLEALNADLSRIRVCEGVATVGRGSRAFTLADIDALTQAVDETPDCRLVVIDPVSAFEPGGKSSTNQKMRAMLAAITSMATEKKLAVLLVTHLTKSGGSSALARIAGTQALCAAARAVWLVAKDPLNVSRRLIVPVKNNLGVDASGLAFEIVGSPPSIHWLADPVTISADDLVRLGGDSRLSEAALFLSELLDGGPLAAALIKAEAEESGLGWRTVQTAKGLLGIRSFRAGGAWFWCLAVNDPRQSKDAKSAKDAKGADRAKRAVVHPLPMLPAGKSEAA